MVTGASSGIGAGLARMLADEGARVVLAARPRCSGAVADSIRERGREAFPIVIDLTADASLANLVERARPELGPIDILINDAGFAVTWGMSFRVQTGLTFLQVEEVVEIVRFLLHTGENVKLGPEILVRTMRNPMPA